ncbi:MAG: OmpP1/FadL family transporter [Granulosicoccaceae bacterium]
MKKNLIALGLALPASVFAGGFERDTQTPNYLFNDGRYAEFSFSTANPNVEGSVPLGPTTQNSGDAISTYSNLSFAYKAPINDKMDWSIAYLEPYGADVYYRNTDPLYTYNDSWAELGVRGLTALLKYKIGDRFSVYGGAKLSEFSADADVNVTISLDGVNPLRIIDYQVRTEKDRATGYVFGAAYEMKEIAMRVALTYNSEIEHESSVVESATGVDVVGGTGPYNIPDTANTVDTTLPQSVNLSFQTGINPKTLLFGSVHWAEWSANEMNPPVYFQVTGGNKLVDHDDDTTTYRLGLGRRINDQVSLALILGHEAANGEVSANLAPTDGFDSITLAGSFKHDEHATLRAGISFIEIGDTTTNAAGQVASFESNDAIGFGVTYSYKF